MRQYIAILILILSAALPGFSQGTLWDIQKDLAFLASDLTEGRFSGSEGERLSARYIAERFQQSGLKPAGTEGYFQSFSFVIPSHPHDTNPQGDPIVATNVMGYIDNKAAQTVVIGAHYDHLGHGAHGSRHTGEPEIHNGADDNASGVAAMLYLADHLSKGSSKGHNYLFIGFSGEELGLFGSKYYVENPTLPLEQVTYMLNMDMVGRLDTVLVINGAGTSPSWKTAFEKIATPGYTVTTTDSGVGPSDHTAFYLKGIPAVHFFTGQHMDYHKPVDDAHLINYEGIEKVGQFMLSLISALDGPDKITYQKTKEESQGRSMGFKVTLGVMPDYTYTGEGLRLDGVIEDRPAKKAGLQSGDIVLQIGTLEIKTIQDYMAVLASHEKGDKVAIRYKRGEEIQHGEVEF